MKYGNRSLWKRFIASPISLVVMALVVFMLARATININKKAELSEMRLDQAQASLGKLIEHQDEITRKVDRLSTDQGVEAELRTKYHAVKDGEEVAVIIDDQKPKNKSDATSTDSFATSTSWWHRLWTW